MFCNLEPVLIQLIHVSYSFSYTLLITGNTFAVPPLPAQIIGLCQNQSEAFLSGVFKVDFDLIFYHHQLSELLT